MTADRILSALGSVVCLYFMARAAYLLYAVNAVINYLPAPMKANGEPVCPPSTLFSGETEQILILLVCLIGLLAARVIWRRGVARVA